MTFPAIGTTIHVWPAPGLRVQELAEVPGRFLPPEGKRCTWTPWLQRRLATGEIRLVNPQPAPAPSPAPKPTTLAPSGKE